MSTLLLVDSGTSTTRVRLWHDGHVLAAHVAAVGGRDAAGGGGTSKLEAVLGRAVEHLRAAAPNDVDAMVCSGMITSNVGLHMVPHVLAPAGLDVLARATVRWDVASVSDIPTYFIPGVRTESDAVGWVGVEASDVMRGEEVECLGLTHMLAVEPPAVYLHCGSHHKIIMQGADGRLERSRTSLTGELLDALARHTILAGSVDLDTLPEESGGDVHEQAWRAGLSAAQRLGVGRALFLVRVADVVKGLPPAAATSFLLGALLSLDMQLFDDIDVATTPIFIYGSGAFPRIACIALQEVGAHRVVVVAQERAEVAAAYGARTTLGHPLEELVEAERWKG